MLTTFNDCVDHLLDFAEVSPSQESARFARRAVNLAMNTIPQMRRWSYYYSPFLANTSASQTDGTIAYDHTGGANERQVTLTDATWPTWAALGVLRIGQVDYEIVSRVSPTIITLSENSNPGADVASGTAYTIYRNQYPLPNDFLAIGNVHNQTNSSMLIYVEPTDWHERTRAVLGPGLPVCYTIMGSRNYLNTMTMFLWPAPDAAYSLAGLYQRAMRRILVQDYTDGTLTVTSNSTSVTGTGTAWTSRMEGSVIRFGSSITNPPTGMGGSDPFEVERMITDVASATSLTIDAVTGTAYTGTKYRISDPVDIAEGNMQSFFLRECEKQFRAIRRMEPMKGGVEAQDYAMAQTLAFESDSRNFEQRYVHGGRWFDSVDGLPFRYFPLTQS